MGDTTDDLLALATSITDDPNPRELDMLVATGEQVSCALVAMALQSIGVNAVSLTGQQAGIFTGSQQHQAGRVRGCTQGSGVCTTGRWSWPRYNLPSW
jgi:aspartate kinase